MSNSFAKENYDFGLKQERLNPRVEPAINARKTPMQQEFRGKIGIEKTTETEPKNVKKGLDLFYLGFILRVRQR